MSGGQVGVSEGQLENQIANATKNIGEERFLQPRKARQAVLRSLPMISGKISQAEGHRKARDRTKDENTRLEGVKKKLHEEREELESQLRRMKRDWEGPDEKTETAKIWYLDKLKTERARYEKELAEIDGKWKNKEIDTKAWFQTVMDAEKEIAKINQRCLVLKTGIPGGS
jgi:chromosome segregation ATPase